MQNGERYLVVDCLHVCFGNLAQSGTDLLHDVKQDIPLFIKLVFVLLAEAEECDAACQDSLVVAG